MDLESRRQDIANIMALSSALGGAALKAAQFAQKAIPEKPEAVLKAPEAKIAELGIEALRVATEGAIASSRMTADAISRAEVLSAAVLMEKKG